MITGFVKRPQAHYRSKGPFAWLLILFDFLIQLAAVARAPIGVVFLDFGQLFKRRICVQVADFVNAVHGEFLLVDFNGLAIAVIVIARIQQRLSSFMFLRQGGGDIVWPAGPAVSNNRNEAGLHQGHLFRSRTQNRTVLGQGHPHPSAR